VAIDRDGVKSVKKARQLRLNAWECLRQHGRGKAPQPSFFGHSTPPAA